MYGKMNEEQLLAKIKESAERAETTEGLKELQKLVNWGVTLSNLNNLVNMFQREWKTCLLQVADGQFTCSWESCFDVINLTPNENGHTAVLLHHRTPLAQASHETPKGALRGLLASPDFIYAMCGVDVG